MRRKLEKYGTWDKLVASKQQSNPSQELKRLIYGKENNGGAIKDIEDLTLLAKSLPLYNVKQIFEHDKIRKLLLAIIYDSNDINKNNNLPFYEPNPENDIWALQLSALLVQIGIDKCVSYYESSIEPHPIFNESTIEKLKVTRDICEAISGKAKLKELKKRKDMTYLFNWNNIDSRYDKKYYEDYEGFLNFCKDEIIYANNIIKNRVDINSSNISSLIQGPDENQYYKKIVNFEIGLTVFFNTHSKTKDDVKVVGLDQKGYMYIDKINHSRNPNNYIDKHAYFCLINADGNCYYKHELVIEVEGENVYVFKRHNDHPEFFDNKIKDNIANTKDISSMDNLKIKNQ